MTRDRSGTPASAGAGPLPLLLGFLAGALSVLIFHQGMLALLHVLGLTPGAPYSMEPTRPLGVPQVLSLAFWGGLWGIVLAFLLARSRAGRSYWIAALAFGAILPTLVAWFVVAPLKEQPLAAGGQPSAMLTGVLVNAAWGLGAALLLRWLRMPRSATPAHLPA